MRGRLAASVAFTLAGALAMSGCGSSTEPELYDWSGTWNGTIQDSTSGPGTLTLTLTQTGSDVNGTGTLTITALQVLLTGTATGTVTDTQMNLTVAATLPFSCSLTVVGTRSGDTVTGTYQPAICPANVGGTFTLTRQ